LKPEWWGAPLDQEEKYVGKETCEWVMMMMMVVVVVVVVMVMVITITVTISRTSPWGTDLQKMMTVQPVKERLCSLLRTPS
jgi:uncharacterized membrane protein